MFAWRDGIVDGLACDIAVVNEMSSGLLQSPVSGLLGLAWQSIATSGQMPFWQTLAGSGTLDSALFAVQLRR